MERLRAIRARREHGVTTAEYAMTAVAACGFGGILLKLLTSQTVVSMLLKTLQRAFNLSF